MTQTEKKIASLLTICRKARKLALGFDPAKESMQAKKAYIILLTSDISPKTAKEAVFFSTKYGVKLQRTSLTSARIKELLGKTAVVMAVNDEGFGKKFEELLNLVHSDTKENEVEYDKENKTD